MRFRFRAVASLVAAVAVVGCGGGGGGGNSEPVGIAPPPGAPPGGLDISIPAPAPAPAEPTTSGPAPAPSVPAPAPAPAPMPAGLDLLPRIEPYERLAAASSAGAGTGAGAGGTVVQTRAAPLPLVRPLPVRVPVDAGGATATRAQAKPGAAVQIGHRRRVTATEDAQRLGALLDWQPHAAGGFSAALAFDSEGAAALRIGLLVESLPDAATVRVYAPQQPAEATLTGAALKAAVAVRRGARASDAAYWLPAVQGPQAVLEIELPADVSASAVRLAVAQVSHLWVAPQAPEAMTTKIGEAGSCNLDATCSPEYDAAARSVARMVFVNDGDAYLCSGTLLADAPASGRPFFLTANHCISDEATAASLSTYWFYSSSACSSNLLTPRATPLHGGATLRFTSTDSDVTLLELAEPPPVGALYSGSILGTVPAGVPVSGLHHPAGDLLKLSMGDVIGYARCGPAQASGSFGCTTTTADDGTDLGVRWRAGVTQPGSSGSALFAGIGTRHYVVGQLRGGGSSCAAPQSPDVYGRFDRGYAAGIRDLIGSPAGSR